MPNFKLLQSFAYRLEADVAKSKLGAHNIPSFVTADDAGGFYPFQFDAKGVQLMVREKDLEKARSILSTQ